MPAQNIVIAEDGVVVDLVGGQIAVAGMVPCGYVYVDGLSVGEVTEASLKDRLILGEEGFISVVVVVDSTSGKLVAGPEIHARGAGIDDAGLAEVRPLIEEALAGRPRTASPRCISFPAAPPGAGRWVSDNYRRRPMIIPVVVEKASSGRYPRLAVFSLLRAPILARAPISRPRELGYGRGPE